MLTIIISWPELQAGHGPGLLLEPEVAPADEKGREELINSVWPFVVSANKESVAHGQIGRNFITLTDPNKPLPRAGKGTESTHSI